MTINALGNPAPWSWRCFFGFHHWLRWSEPEQISTALRTEMKVQRRVCNHCNRMQVRGLVIQQSQV